MKKEIKLTTGTYSESALVDEICSEAQQRAYHKKEKFAGGKYQSMFLNALSNYCAYEYNPKTKQYTITELFKLPKTPTNKKIYKGIYQHLIPLILNDVLFGKINENPDHLITLMDLARTIKLINSNYDKLRYNQDAAYVDMKFSPYILSEYFNRVEGYIRNYINRSIKYLEDMSCIVCNESYAISTMPNMAEFKDKYIIVSPEKARKATEEEVELYSDIVYIASQIAGIKYYTEKWYGRKAHHYQVELSHLMREKGIIYMRKAFEFSQINKERCEEILQSFNKKTIEQHIQEVKVLFKKILDINTEKRAIKNSNLEDDYVEQFTKLSKITLLSSEEDVLKSLPSAENKTYQEIMQKKYGLEIKYHQKKL